MEWQFIIAFVKCVQMLSKTTVTVSNKTIDPAECETSLDSVQNTALSQSCAKYSIVTIISAFKLLFTATECDIYMNSFKMYINEDYLW